MERGLIANKDAIKIGLVHFKNNGQKTKRRMVFFLEAFYFREKAGKLEIKAYLSQ